MSVKQKMISVLMPVYNGEKYLAEAIDSILNQSFGNFELLILLEYGSNEESKKIIASYNDDRIRVIENSERLGLPLSLNKGIELAEGKYIARMDSDDISLKNRFKIQYDFLEEHPEISLCGSSIKINGKGRKLLAFETAEAIKFGAYFECMFHHPTVMWRKEDFIKENLYYKNLPQSEDYELWTRVVCCLKVVNINKVLLKYRAHNGNKSVLGKNELNQIDIEIKRFYWNKNGLDYDNCFGNSSQIGDIITNSQYIDLFRIKCVADKTKEFKEKKKIIQRYVLTNLLSRGYGRKQMEEIIKVVGLDKFFVQKWDCLYMIYRIVRHKCRKLID